MTALLDVDQLRTFIAGATKSALLRSGAPWRDLPVVFGPYTTCYNRFVRWRRAGVWSRIIDALAAPPSK